MTSFKNMKINVSDPLMNSSVRDALANEGYDICEHGKNYEYFVNAKAFFTYDSGVVMKADKIDDYFKNHSNEEHFLCNGKFVSWEYFKQPETPKVNIPERYENPKTDEDKAVKDAFDKAIEKIYEPLGLLPKNIHDKQRMYEILDAMRRYVDADKKIPLMWIAELDDLGGEYVEEEF